MDYVLYTDAHCNETGKHYGNCSAVYLLMDSKGNITSYEVLKIDNISEPQIQLYAIGMGIDQAKEKSNIHVYTDSIYAINILTDKWAAQANLKLIGLVKEAIKRMRSVNFHFWKHGSVSELYHKKALKPSKLPKPEFDTSDLFEVYASCAYTKEKAYSSVYKIVHNGKTYGESSFVPIISKPQFCLSTAIHNAINSIPINSTLELHIQSKVDGTGELAANKFTSENIMSLYCDRYKIKIYFQ